MYSSVVQLGIVGKLHSGINQARLLLPKATPPKVLIHQIICSLQFRRKASNATAFGSLAIAAHCLGERAKKG